MIKFFNLKKLRKPVYSSEHVSWLERLGEDAHVGWAVIVSVSCFVAFVLISYTGWLFYLVNSGGIAPSETVVSPVQYKIFDQKGLKSIIDSFGEKAGATSALLKGYDVPADPSR